MSVFQQTFNSNLNQVVILFKFCDFSHWVTSEVNKAQKLVEHNIGK